jgi:hypothetical protein
MLLAGQGSWPGMSFLANLDTNRELCHLRQPWLLRLSEGLTDVSAIRISIARFKVAFPVVLQNAP